MLVELSATHRRIVRRNPDRRRDPLWWRRKKRQRRLPPIKAAIAQRAGNSTAFASSSSGSLTGFNCQAGDVIVVIYSIRTATSTGNAPTDTIGNTYTQAKAINNTVRAEVWTTVSSGSNASNVITFHLSATSKIAVSAESYSGAAGINPANAVSTTQSSANPTQSLTLTAANNWFVAGFSGESTGTFTISTGNNRQNSVTSGGSSTTNVGGALGDNTASSASSVTVAYTNADTLWAMVGVELVQPPSDDCESWEGSVGLQREVAKVQWDDVYDQKVVVPQ